MKGKGLENFGSETKWGPEKNLKARGGVQGQKLDFLYFFIVKSSTFEGIITFYRVKISFDTLKILSVKVRTYCQIYGIFNTI